MPREVIRSYPGMLINQLTVPVAEAGCSCNGLLLLLLLCGTLGISVGLA